MNGTISSSSKPELPRVDLSQASTRNRAETTLEHKWFKIQLKGSLQVLTVNVDAAEVGTAFTKICGKLNVDEVGAMMVFPQRTQSGGMDEITVINDDYIHEALMNFYLTCEESSKIIVIPYTKKANPPRDYRPTEYGYNTIVGPTFAVDRTFYEYLQEKLDVVEKFFHKREYINLILGRDCNNFLSPTHYLCPLRGCEKEVPLGGFNKISTIVKHMRTHSVKGDQFSKTFMRRHNHKLKSSNNQGQSSTPTETVSTGTKKAKKAKKDDCWVRVLDFEAELLNLDEEVEPALTRNKLFIDPETTGEFNKGKHLMVDMSIMRKILMRDGDALAMLEKGKTVQTGINSFFGKAAERNRREKWRRRKSVTSVGTSSSASTSKHVSLTNKSSKGASNTSVLSQNTPESAASTTSTGNSKLPLKKRKSSEVASQNTSAALTASTSKLPLSSTCVPSSAKNSLLPTAVLREGPSPTILVDLTSSVDDGVEKSFLKSAPTMISDGDLEGSLEDVSGNSSENETDDDDDGDDSSSASSSDSDDSNSETGSGDGSDEHDECEERPPKKQSKL